MMRRREVLRGLMLGAALPGVSQGQEGGAMRIHIAFDDQRFTASLEDNASAREFAAMLPLDLTMSDFGGNEKISYLPEKLTALVRGPVPDAAPGDLCYYVPWGNLAFFHGRYESTRDLVRLGRLEGSVGPLLVRGEFAVRIEGV
ncbi:cyclophilin-like fold protein [Devosia sp. Root413D1]|uniref:cyclophilin-like fold protein n=1 Tax=unclassified Devosia TaxID=196773 RepID=UPI00190FF401|nr:cyclophilin-like fold protein [Devosia sp. Root413D1]